MNFLMRLLSCWPELRLQEVLRPASLGHRRLVKHYQNRTYRIRVIWHSDKEVDDETPTGAELSQISNNIIYNAVAF